MRWTAFALVSALAITACQDSNPTAPQADLKPQFAAAPAFGTTTDIEDTYGVPSVGAVSGFDRGFRNQVVAQFGDVPAMERIFRRWLDAITRARLIPANTDLELFLALSDYLSWRLSVESVLPGDVATLFRAELDFFMQAAADRLARAIDGNITVCRTNQSLAALANVVLWFSQAEAIGVTETPHWTLTRDDVSFAIQRFCVAVEVPTVAFPDPVFVNQSFTLTTQAVLRFVGQTTTVPAAFMMTIIYSPGIGLPDAFTDAAGAYSTPLSFPAIGPMIVRAVACLVLPGRTEPTFLVCGLGSGTGNVIDPMPPPPPPPPPPADVSGVWEADFSYLASTAPGGELVPARITLTLTQSGGNVTGTWVLDDGLHAGPISFGVGGIDPACSGCGYLITNFDMTGNAPGRWFVLPGEGHVGEPALGRSIVMDIGGVDGHGTIETQHTWLKRRVLFRPVVP